MYRTRRTLVPWLAASRGLLLGLGFLAAPAVLAQDAPPPAATPPPTAEPAYLIAGGLKLRLEYRGDFMQGPFFTDDAGKEKDSQHAVLVGIVYAFGGKI